MYILLPIAALIFMVSGIVLELLSLREKKPEAPSFPSFNPRLWFTPIWKQRDWFTPSGYHKHVLGCSLMGFGGLINLVIWLPRVLG